MKSLLLIVAAAGSMMMAGAAMSQSGMELAKAKNCLGCHDMDKKKVGPSFKDIAAKYKDNKEAEGKLVAALKEGKGHPTKAAATDAEIKTLVQFSLSGK